MFFFSNDSQLPQSQLLITLVFLHSILNYSLHMNFILASYLFQHLFLQKHPATHTVMVWWPPSQNFPLMLATYLTSQYWKVHKLIHEGRFGYLAAGLSPGLPNCSQILYHLSHSVQFSSVAQLCPTLFDPMDCSMPGFPVHHQLPKLTQTHVYWVGGAFQLPHPLLSPSIPAFKLSQHQGLFQSVSSSHQVAKVSELQF